MNYLETHPGVRKFITEYIDDLHNHFSVMKIDGFIVMTEINEEVDDYVVMEYDSSDGRLYIEKKFLDKFSILFPLDMKESKSFIKDWFENMYDVKIKYVDS